MTTPSDKLDDAARIGSGYRDWEWAARRLGEMMSADGPKGYYQFTPEQLVEWASSLQSVALPEIGRSEPQEPVRMSPEGRDIALRSGVKQEHYDAVDRYLKSAPRSATQPSVAPGSPFIVDLDSALRHAEAFGNGDIHSSVIRKLWENHCDAAARSTSGKICRADGRCQYAIDAGAEGLGHCPEGKCAMPSAGFGPIDGNPANTSLENWFPYSAEELTRLRQNAGLAAAALAYDAAIRACANDPQKMASFCTAEGDDLDTLYDNLMAAARAVQSATGALSK